MGKKRLLFWIVFFAAVGVVAVGPEFMTESVPSVAPAARPAAALGGIGGIGGIGGVRCSRCPPRSPGHSAPGHGNSQRNGRCTGQCTS